MNTTINSFYAILSQSFFVPSILSDPHSYKEPFKSFINSFKKEVVNNRDNLTKYLSRGEIPFWSNPIFIPNIGKISFDLKKNVPSRLLLGYSPPSDDCWDDFEKANDSKYTYTNSKNFYSTLHLPFLIKYRKKVSLKPSFNEFVKHYEFRTLNKCFSPKQITQNAYVYVHFYPYGLFVCNLAISVSSPLNSDFAIKHLISWLHAIKAGKNKSKIQLTVKNKFQGTVEEFFQYLFTEIHKKVITSKSQQYIKSQIYDSVRIKPIESIDSSLIKKVCQKEEKRSTRLSSSSDRGADNRAIQLTRALIKSYKKELSIKEYSALGIKPEKWMGNPSSISEQWKSAFTWQFHELRKEFNFDGLHIDGDHEELSQLYLEIRYFLKENKTNFLNYWLSFFHKAIKDTLLKTIRRAFSITLSDKEIGGILSKQEGWMYQRGVYESEFGKYENDLLIPKSRSTLILLNTWARRKQLQLIFQWQLQAVREIAISQKLIVSHYIKQLSCLSIEPRNKSLFIKDSEIQFLYGLTNIYIHLPPHFRKWYYLISNAMGVKKDLEIFIVELDNYVKGFLKNQNELRYVQYIINLQESMIDHVQIGDYNNSFSEREKTSMENKKHFLVDNQRATIGQQQIGNQNRMEHFENVLNSRPIEHKQSKDLKAKIIELQKAIEHTNLQDYEKVDISQDLQNMIQELQKTSKTQDLSKINHYWKKVVALVKDISTISGMVNIINGLL